MQYRLLSVALPAVFITVSSAYAAKSGWYLGAGAGQSKARDLGDISVSTADLEDIVTTKMGYPLTLGVEMFKSSDSLDDKDTGWKAYAGYRINDNLAIEAGYTNIGKFAYQSAFTFYGSPDDYDGSASLRARAKAWTLSVLGIVPLAQQFELFGKLGLARWDVKTTGSITVNNQDVVDTYSDSVSSSKKGTGLNFGLGAVYKFNANLGLRAEWERFNDVGKEDVTGKSDIDLLSIGLMYSF